MSLVSDMAGGLIALGVTLAVATAAGLVMQLRGGRFRPVRRGLDHVADGVQTVTDAAGASAPGAREVLTAADLGVPLGERATLVQFSTAFCAPCRPARRILTQVATMVDGVQHVDIDATQRLDLVRRLRVHSTPTVFVLDQAGAIAKRAAGVPRKADVIAVLGNLAGPR